jgi:DNA-binding FrmR family transcriptional regulator
MHIAESDVPPIANRLRRAHGQLAAVIRMLEAGDECEAIVTQLAATSKAIDRAGFGLVSAGLRECLRHEDSEPDLRKLEKLFLSLS